MAEKQEVDPRMVKARTSLVMKQPFYGTLAMYLELVAKPGIETMATDGTHLFYEPAYLDTLTESEIEGVVAHEVDHCAKKHHLRRGNRDADLWNDSCDLASNPDLKRAGFRLPDGHLDEPEFRGMCAEEIYAVKKKQKEEQEQQQQQSGGKGQGQQQPGQGQSTPQAGQQQSQQGQGQNSPQGQNGPQQPPQPGQQGGSGQGQASPSGGSMGKVLDACPEHAKAELGEEEAKWDERVQAALAVEARRAGTLPGHLQALATYLRQPQTDWREQLRRFVDDRNRVDFSFTRPNRRLMGRGFIFPGYIPDGVNHLGVEIDVSGSTKSMWNEFAAQLHTLVNDGACEKLTIIYVDTQVRKVETFQAGDEVKLRFVGGGGTILSAGIEWFEENVPDLSAIVCFTDLENDRWGDEPAVPVLWAAVGQANKIRALTEKVPYGEVIHLRD